MITGNHTPAQLDVPPLTQKSRLLLKGSDVIGLVGVVMLLFGAWFIFAGRYPPPLWITWFVGPTLWYVGVATTVIWLLWRLFGLRSSAVGKGSPRGG